MFTTWQKHLCRVHEQCAEGYEIVHGITHYMVLHTNSGAQPACPRVRVQIPFLCFFFLTCFRFSSISCCLSFRKFACFVHCFVFRLTHHRLDWCSAEPNRIIASFDRLCICTLRSNISPSAFLRCKFYKGTFDYDFSHALQWCNSRYNVTFGT